MKYLSDYSNELNHYSNNDFEIAQQKLQSNMKQSNFFRTEQYSFQKGENLTVDFSGENQRRSFFMDCQFKNSNFMNMGMTGSLFKLVTFENCKIDNTKLDSCDFEECTFISNKTNENYNMHNLNLSKSIILNSSFKDCNLIGSNFTDTVFIDTMFENCIWQSLALENCVLKNTTLDSVELKKLNFEFSHFDGIIMNNIRLPFPTIPYIFGGLTYLMETKDKVYISSANSKNGKISINEYLSYMNDLEVFYTKTQNYFPLANIYISLQKWEKAYSAIMVGIGKSMQLHSYRMVYYFCKLLQLYNDFSIAQCSSAYDLIIQLMHSNGFHLQDQYNIKRYIEPIRNMLLNERESFLTINILTDIEDSEYDKLVCLYEVIDKTVKYIELNKKTKIKYYIESRHNCPYEFLIKFFSEPQNLIFLAGCFHFIFTGMKKIYEMSNAIVNNHLDKKIKAEKLMGIKLDNKIKEKEIEEKDLDIELKKLQIKNNQYINNQDKEEMKILEEKHQELINHNIKVVSGNHIISDFSNNIECKDIYIVNY